MPDADRPVEAQPATQRLFFALWPDAGVRAALAAVGRAHALHNGRAVAAANLHMTLAFVGSVDAARRECLEAAAATVVAPALSVCFDRLGFWPRPRILWAGASAAPAALGALVEALTAALVPCGHKPDPRPFRAHVTLARKALRAPAVERIMPVVWPADAFCLVESVSGPAGSEYRVLRRWPLRMSRATDA